MDSPLVSNTMAVGVMEMPARPSLGHAGAGAGIQGALEAGTPAGGIMAGLDSACGRRRTREPRMPAGFGSGASPGGRAAADLTSAPTMGMRGATSGRASAAARWSRASPSWACGQAVLGEGPGWACGARGWQGPGKAGHAGKPDPRKPGLGIRGGAPVGQGPQEARHAKVRALAPAHALVVHLRSRNLFLPARREHGKASGARAQGFSSRARGGMR